MSSKDCPDCGVPDADQQCEECRNVVCEDCIYQYEDDEEGTRELCETCYLEEIELH